VKKNKIATIRTVNKIVPSLKLCVVMMNVVPKKCQR